MVLTRSSRENQDIKQLRIKAQYLRGPSATLGIYKVNSICGRIEQMTVVADTFHAKAESKAALCNSTRILLDQAKQHFAEAESALRRFYGMEWLNGTSCHKNGINFSRPLDIRYDTEDLMTKWLDPSITIISFADMLFRS
jgi:hypothetical protein